MVEIRKDAVDRLPSCGCGRRAMGGCKVVQPAIARCAEVHRLLTGGHCFLICRRWGA